MSRITLALSGILIVVGIVSYAISDFTSWTALIPAFLGLLIGICGLIARKRKKIGISIAFVIATLGVLGTSMNALKIGEVIAGQAERPLAVVASTITFILLIGYIVLGIRSLLTARRRTADEVAS